MGLFKEKFELEVAETEIGIKKMLSGYPKALRWFLIVCVLAIVPSFFVAKAISHKIWQQKYKTYLITAKPSFENPQELKVKKIQILPYAQNSFLALAEISNENLELSAAQINYVLKFFGPNQKEIFPDSGQVKGTFFILPNKTKYLVSPRIFSKEEIVSAAIVFDKNIHWQKKLNIPKIVLATTIPKLSQQIDPWALVTEGFVENKSAYILKEVRITFLVFDSSKQLLTVSERKDYDLKAGERRGYKQLWPNLFLPNASFVQVVTETNVLDPTNLKLEEQNAGQASDLSRPEMEK